MTDGQTPPQDPLAVGHETSDAEIGPLLRFAVFLTVVVAVTSVLTIGLYNYLDRRENVEKAPQYPLAEGRQRPLPPTPRLQTYPFQDLKQYRSDERQVLDHYAWVDKSTGTVRIPVDRAIEVLAAKGLPHRPVAPAQPAPPAPSAPDTARPAPGSQGSGGH